MIYLYINKRWSDFAISRGFTFRETSHMRSFATTKPSRKFPNLKKMHTKTSGSLDATKFGVKRTLILTVYSRLSIDFSNSGGSK